MISRRPLYFTWIADTSGSMKERGKIQTLNVAIREALPHMRRVASENPNAEVLIRVLAFSSGAHWVVPEPTPIADFSWTDLSAQGVTDMGKAFRMVAEQLKVPPMTNRALPPVLVLVSDGQATDDVQGGLEELMSEPWGAKAVRIGIAIGQDADREVLQRFIGDPKRKPLGANHPDDLVRYIHWASTAVLQSASTPKVAGQAEEPTTGVSIPVPPARAEDGAFASTTW
jgi:uncharacterized protein YegL